MSRWLSRRQLLRWSAGSLLAAGCWPGALRAAASATDDFHFVVINDIHYFDRHCGSWLERVFQGMQRRPEKIDFCLVVGDLVEDGKSEQFSAIRDLLQTLGMPVHVVIGNHDYRDSHDRQAFEQFFPGSLNYRFEHRGWQFVALDSSHGNAVQATVQPATLHWMDEMLPRLDKQRPLVVFTHFPLGPWTPYRVSNAGLVLERWRDFNLQAIYNGHFHALTERSFGHASITTNRCCSYHRQNHDGDKRKGYFLCQARAGKIQRTFVDALPIPASSR